jgi:cysteinyl-tRNA synthetase
MAKSKKNFYKLSDIVEKGHSPLAFRYLCENSHYRSPMNFTWESITASENSLKNLRRHINTLPDGGNVIESAIKEFSIALEDDINIPMALAALHKILSSGNLPADIKATIKEFDKVLALSLFESENIEIPEKIQKLADERKTARDNKEWKKSDEIRNIISEAGFEVLDQKDGNFKIVKK